MKRLIIIIALLMLAGPTRADHLVRADGDTVRLLDTPCVLPNALARVNPQYASINKAGIAMFSGEMRRFCWLLVDGSVRILDEYDQYVRVPWEAFEEEPGI